MKTKLQPIHGIYRNEAFPTVDIVYVTDKDSSPVALLVGGCQPLLVTHVSYRSNDQHLDAASAPASVRTIPSASGYIHFVSAMKAAELSPAINLLARKSLHPTHKAAHTWPHIHITYLREAVCPPGCFDALFFSSQNHDIIRSFLLCSTGEECSRTHLLSP